MPIEKVVFYQTMISLCSFPLIWYFSKTSGQDGGIGRHTVPPRITKTRTTTNLKTKNNQNCQKIELYGSLTTKELQKHSSRPATGVKTGNQVERTRAKAMAGEPEGSHICVQINQEEQLGSETDLTTRGSSTGK